MCHFLPGGRSPPNVLACAAFIEQLPDVLVIQLKRLQYDVHTYQMAKVKDRFFVFDDAEHEALHTCWGRGCRRRLTQQMVRSWPRHRGKGHLCY